MRRAGPAGRLAKAAIIQPFACSTFMRVTHGAARAALAPAAVTIGNFDGVHMGHQAMLRRVIGEARARSIESCVLTFEPHPREVFEKMREKMPDRLPGSSGNGTAPTRLTSLREKLELLEASGADRVHIERFSPAFAALSPEDFVRKVLIKTLSARWVLVGDDFRFGAKRAGNFELMRAMGEAGGFGVDRMGSVMLHGIRVSSGAVREALADGDVARAQSLLGRPYSISGRVIHGRKLGRTLGFATANIQMKHNRPPLAGIFVVRLHGVGETALPGVASLGVRPTVDSVGKATLEVHLFDFSSELYGRHVRVDFLKKIRNEEKYPDLEALRSQITRDCEAARAYHREHAGEDPGQYGAKAQARP